MTPPWRRTVVLRGGQRIALRGSGAPLAEGEPEHTDGAAADSAPPTLLCLHGMPGRGADFDPLLLALPEGWRAIAVDRAGYGDSRPLLARTAAGPHAEAERLLEVLDTLGLERVLLVAWSWAGLIAGEVSRRAPTRFRGVLLLGAAGPALQFPRDLLDRLLFRSPIGGLLLRLAAAVGPGAFRRALDDAFGEPAPASLLDCLVEDAQRPCSRRRWLEDGRSLRPPDIVLPPSDVPTWLLHGTADRSVPVEVARDTVRRRPDVRLVELPGVGHWPFRTSVGATLRTLRALADATVPETKKPVAPQGGTGFQ